MNKQLYENIVNSISKSIKQSLSESLFDDEEVFGDEGNVIHSSMVMGNQMIDMGQQHRQRCCLIFMR